MTTSYQPGSAYAVVGARGAALLDPSVAPEVVEAVWGVLGDAAGGGVGAVLQVLTGAFGTSLTTIPPFAVVDRQDDGLHLAVRGGFAVRVNGATGSHTVSGEGVSTWHERLEADADEVELVVPGAVEPHPALPLGTGVVLACAVRADLRSGPGAAVPPLRASVLAAPAVVPAVVSADFPAVVPTAVVPTAVVPVEVPPDDPAGVPVDTRLPEVETPDAPAPAPGEGIESTRTDVEGDYDFLWGSTVLRSIEDAAVRVDPEEEDEDPVAVVTAEQPVVPAPPATDPGPDPVAGLTPTAPPARAAVQGGWTPPALLVSTAAQAPLAELGDHDGETILGSGLAGLRTDAPPVLLAHPAEPALTSGAIAVLARRCVDGHPNPPEALTCLTCSGALDRDAVRMVRPSLGRVRLSTGQEVPLDRPLVIGRKPRVSRVQNDNLPRLVTVPSPEQDISRSHLEVRLEGWHVLLVDLGSTNGSTLLRPGQAPVRLHPQEPTLAVTGDVVDLGDGVQLTFEDLP